MLAHHHGIGPEHSPFAVQTTNTSPASRLDAWTREQRPVTADVPAARVGALAPLKIRPVVADAAYVQSHLGRAGFVVIDGCTAGFYDGVQTGGGPTRPHKTGHIAGATSVPFTTLTTNDGLLKPASELKTIFAEAGAKPGDTIVGYCHIGQQARAMLSAARTLGFKVALYDGSFEDWSRKGLPVETSAPKGK